MLTQHHGYALAAGLLKRKLPHIQIGRICLGIDIIVIILYAVAFQSLTNALYAGIALFISSFAMDAVIYGRRTSKEAVIITERGEDYIRVLLEQNLGITQIRAHLSLSAMLKMSLAKASTNVT